MVAPKEPESFPDHGDGTNWANLSAEESRCLVGLVSYYKTFEDRIESIAAELAWRDVKREHPRLDSFTWYRLGA